MWKLWQFSTAAGALEHLGLTAVLFLSFRRVQKVLHLLLILWKCSAGFLIHEGKFGQGLLYKARHFWLFTVYSNKVGIFICRDVARVIHIENNYPCCLHTFYHQKRQDPQRLKQVTVKPVSKHCQRSSLDPSYPLFAHQPVLGEQTAWYQKTLLHCHCFSLGCKEMSSQKSCLQAF